MVKVCKKCAGEFSLNKENFYEAVTKNDGFDSYCKPCRRAQSGRDQRTRRDQYSAKQKQWTADHRVAQHGAAKQWRNKNHIACRLRAIRNRAKKQGISFSITKADVIVPEFCPILGIPLFYTAGEHSPNSPSIDRIIPKLGYVVGNIQVISMRANTIKHNATFEELVKVGEWAALQTKG